MLHKKHNALVTFTLLLALMGVTKPAKAYLTAQSVRGNLVADTNLNAELEDSGSANTDLKESGRVNPDLEGSGTFNSNFDGGGEVNADFSDSGLPKAELEDSGEVNPDLESSGEPLSSDKDMKTKGEVAVKSIPGKANEKAVSTDNLEIERKVIVQNNTVEETPDIEIAAERKSSWWWWLIPLIGIPLLAVIIALGGRGRSDREPAIDPGDGGMGFAAPADGDGDGLSGVGANNASSVNASMVGGAMAGGTALSGGSATVGDRQVEIEPEPTDSVAGIPSDSVSEFTGQESKLQVDNRSAMLQTDDEDTDPDRPEFFDRVAQSGASVAGTMGLGSVVAGNRDRDNTVADEGTISSELDTDLDGSEQLTDFPATVNEPVESVPASDVVSETTPITEADVGREFRGDYVLQEEPVTPKDIPNSNISNPDIELELEQTTDDTWETSTELADNRATAETIINEDTTAELNLNYSATDRDLVEDEIIDAESTLDVESDNVIDLRQDSNISSETDVSPANVDTLAIADTNITDSPESEDLTVNEEPLTDVETNLDDDTGFQADLTDETATAANNFWEPSLSDNEIDTELTVEESVTTDSELDRDFSLDTDDGWTDRSETVDNTSAIDAELNLVEERDAADDVKNEPYVVQQQQETREIEDFKAVETGDRNFEIDDAIDSQNSNLDRILDDTDDSDLVLDDLGFDESGDEIILEEITFDESVNNDIRLEDLSLDDTVDNDTSWDELTLENDSDDAIDAILEEITFEESANDRQFEELSFEPSIDDDISLEEIMFDEPAVNDSDLEDPFESSDLDRSLVSDLEDSNSDLNVDLDSLGFEEVENNSTLNLLENNTADIADLSDNKSEDMSNISEWLNSLEATRQNTDDISEWLNSLNTGDLDSVRENHNEDRVMDLEEQSDDVSFQFLEDLLERDSNKSQNNDDLQ